MTIASEITRIKNNIASAYTACNNMGATMPVTQNSANLANCIDTIIAETPTEALTITPTTSQQTFTATGNIDGYTPVTLNAVTASIDSDIAAGNIKSGISILGVTGNYIGNTPTKYGAAVDSLLGDVNNNGVLQIPTWDTNLTFTGVENIAGSALHHKFYNCTNIESISFPSLTTVSGGSAMQHAFHGCTGITSVDLSALTTVSGDSGMASAFYGCTGITSVDLSALTTVSGGSGMANAFQGCTGITSVDLSALTTVSGSNAMNSAFSGCTGITSVDLSALTTVNESYAMYSTFSGCTGITSVNLSSLTTVSGSNAMNSAFSGCTGITSVDLSALTTVNESYAMYSTFSGCTGITSVNLSSLTTIGTDSSSTNYTHFSDTFYNCTNLTTLSFPNLEKIYCTGGANYGTFRDNNKVQKMYFPKLDTITYGTGASTTNQNACKNIFSGCASLTELHFGAVNQAAIEASPGYSTAWGRGAGNVTIYFDL